MNPDQFAESGVQDNGMGSYPPVQMSPYPSVQMGPYPPFQMAFGGGLLKPNFFNPMRRPFGPKGPATIPPGLPPEFAPPNPQLPPELNAPTGAMAPQNNAGMWSPDNVARLREMFANFRQRRASPSAGFNFFGNDYSRPQVR